jgi:hypothetical protein
VREHGVRVLLAGFMHAQQTQTHGELVGLLGREHA